MNSGKKIELDYSGTKILIDVEEYNKKDTLGNVVSNWQLLDGKIGLVGDSFGNLVSKIEVKETTVYEGIYSKQRGVKSSDFSRMRHNEDEKALFIFRFCSKGKEALEINVSRDSENNITDVSIGDTFDYESLDSLDRDDYDNDKDNFFHYTEAIEICKILYKKYGRMITWFWSN